MPTGFSWTELGVDPARVEVLREAPLGREREFILYWCQVHHRAAQNHALEAAVALGNHLGLPVVCYQALRPDYPHASDRLHAFVLDGLTELQESLARRGIDHWLELPRSPSAHRRRVAELGRRAAAVVSDLFPTYIVPGQLRAAARALNVPLLAVDASCVVPMKRIPVAQIGARTLRPKIHRLWPEHRQPLEERAVEHPSVGRRRRLEPDFEVERHPIRRRAALGDFDIDHSVRPVEGVVGGREAALRRLERFVSKSLSRFGEGRNDPDDDTSSGLSPYLHFGQLFSGEAVRAAQAALGEDHPGVQAFFEQLVVRRELGFNYCFHTEPPAQLQVESLPAWAQETLRRHRRDSRTERYDDASLETARTGDEIWNAAQNELRTRGAIHNYLRMLWGKKLLEWSDSPEEALRRIAWLNDRYALDGRDPVSVASFMWILGLHDRPFQERPILGKVRPMSSRRTAEKFDLTRYLARYAPPSSQRPLPL